jgi:hypothetical protein
MGMIGIVSVSERGIGKEIVIEIEGAIVIVIRTIEAATGTTAKGTWTGRTFRAVTKNSDNSSIPNESL